MFPCPNCFSLKANPQCLVCRDTIVVVPPITPKPEPKPSKESKKPPSPTPPPEPKKSDDKKDETT